MIKHRCLLVLGLFAVFQLDNARIAAQSFEKELASISAEISSETAKAGKKKVAVLDFTDLQGNANELGRFLAEQVSVDLVIARKDFELVDRANLKSILAEHKLTASGLVHPENAKKLGEFSGLDAIIFGSITPLQDAVLVTIKIIATDTAVVVGAARGRITKSKEILQLLDRELDTSESATSGNEPSNASSKGYQGSTKSQEFASLSVDLNSLRFLADGSILVVLVLKNKAKEQIGVGINSESSRTSSRKIMSTLLDNNGWEYGPRDGDITGMHILPLPLPKVYASRGDPISTFESLVNPKSRSDVDAIVSKMTAIDVGKSLRVTLRYWPSLELGPRTKGGEFGLQMEVVGVKRFKSPTPTAELNSLVFERIKPVVGQ